MSFLKAQVSFPSNLASILSSIKNNSSILFFSSNIIYFGQKKPKVQIFEIFSRHRCHNVVTRSKTRVVPTSVSDVVTTSSSNIIKTLPQHLALDFWAILLQTILICFSLLKPERVKW